MEPDVPSILGRNLNILLLWSYIECTQHDIDIVQQTAEQCASFDWFPQKVLKFSQKKGESVDEIPLMALCFQFIRKNKSISIYLYLSIYVYEISPGSPHSSPLNNPCPASDVQAVADDDDLCICISAFVNNPGPPSGRSVKTNYTL